MYNEKTEVSYAMEGQLGSLVNLGVIYNFCIVSVVMDYVSPLPPPGRIFLELSPLETSPYSNHALENELCETD